MTSAESALHAHRVLTILSDHAAMARSSVAASWARSLKRYRLDPESTQPPDRLDEPTLRRAHERLGELVLRAEPAMDRLFAMAGEAGCSILLTDGDGVPLVRRGAPGDDVDFLRLGLWTGMVWSEASQGTNGVGTALAEGRALTIHREEHFLTRNIDLSCTVAPIWDAQGRLMAALDVSSCRRDLTPALLKLIAGATQEAARRIEAANFRQTFSAARVIVAGEGDDHARGALLAVDREDLIVGANRAARIAFGLNDERLASPFPADDLLSPANRAGADDFSAAERGAAQRALARAGGNVSAAARLLGVSRATLHRKLARLGLDRSR